MDMHDIRRLTRPKEYLRAAFYAMVLEVAFLRGREGSVSLETLEKVSLELPVAAVLGLLLVVVFWHYAIYEPFILELKDLVTRFFRIDNYRHWMKSEFSQGSGDFNPEELYGYLKWECKDFSYPHFRATLVTPALHAFYLIPFAWLLTLFWQCGWDWVITVAVLMIPGSLIADIVWERVETMTFKRQATVIKREVDRLNEEAT